MDRDDPMDWGKLKIVLPGVPARSNRGWLGFCSVVLFPKDDGWALFDTGHYSDRAQLLAALAALNIEPRQIEQVVISHLHFDHVLNLSLFLNACVYIAQAELDYAGQVAARAIDDSSIVDCWQMLLQERETVVIEDSLTPAEGMEIVNLPGHTPGCLAMFIDGPSPIAICGDVIKSAWEAVSGAPATAAADDRAARESIRYILSRSEVIIPGHDMPFKVGRQKVAYLDSGVFEIQGSFYPEPQNEMLLRLATGRKDQVEGQSKV